MTILFLCKQVKHGIIYWLYEETCFLHTGSVNEDVLEKLQVKNKRWKSGKKEEDRKKPIKIETKVNLSVCACGGGVIVFYINKKNKDCVMEICLFPWQRCSHDNCCSGWHRRRHTQKSESGKDAYKLKHMHTRPFPPQLDSPLLHQKVFQCSPAAHLTPPLVFVPPLLTPGVCHFSQIFSKSNDKHLGLCDGSNSLCLKIGLPLSLFFTFLPSFFFFLLVFQHSKHWKGFNRQVVLNQPKNQLICLFVTLPWVFFRGCLAHLTHPFLRTPSHTNTHILIFFQKDYDRFKSIPISIVSI